MPRRPRLIPRVITEDEFRRILQAILTRKKHPNTSKMYADFMKIRDCMMFFLMFYLGLRPKEAYACKVEYLNLHEATLFIPGANNKQRHSDTIPLPSFVVKSLTRYLEIKNRICKESSWLFPSRNHNNKGGMLDSSVVRKLTMGQ
jgi:site-specific recombinase XerD